MVDTGRMPKPHTPLRSFRIPEPLYAAALKKAESEERTLSDVVRELLRDYVKSA